MTQPSQTRRAGHVALLLIGTSLVPLAWWLMPRPAPQTCVADRMALGSTQAQAESECRTSGGSGGSGGSTGSGGGGGGWSRSGTDTASSQPIERGGFGQSAGRFFSGG